MSNKEIFASYLEETAMEIRAFPMTKEYLDDMYTSMQEVARNFYQTEYKNPSYLTIVKD